MIETSWLSDPIGRVNNISLAPNTKNTLQALFEAIMNSIHAIEERFGRDSLASGEITIEISSDDKGNYVGFSITDNGVGLNSDNLESFRKLDSMKKLAFGGKGVGRLLWLKVADTINLKSTYDNGGSTSTLSFDFVLDEKSLIQNPILETIGAEVGTTVKISPLKQAYSSHIPVKLDTISVRAVAHFINYFVKLTPPKIIVFDKSDSINLFDKFSEDVERDKLYEFQHTFKETDYDFSLNCFLVPKKYSDDEKGTNALFFGANGRAVKRYEMDDVIGLKAIDGKYACFSYVESNLLNETVNDTRTEFSLDDDTIDEIKRKCIENIKLFLKDEIEELKSAQIEKIERVRNEHLRFYSIAKNPEEIAEKLHLSVQGDEEIFVELSRQGLRQYKRVKREFNTAKKKNSKDLDERAKAYVSELKSESLSSLAEYVYKRKLIIDYFEEKSGFDDVEKENAHLEKIVHEIICPMNSSKEELSYDDHNLWIVDDRLAFYSYFNSDKALKSQSASDDKKRPDITLFDLGIGLEKSASFEPITIVEFKRPKRDDYSMSDNPFSQVQQYVELLKNAGGATKFDGKVLRAIEKNTPFMCQIVADDTPTLKKVMKDYGGFNKKAGTKSYYRWDESYKIFMEVISYNELISNAKARHEAFFDKLGIKP